MLPSTTKLLELRTLINQRHYFVIHALRQVVKNTAILTLAQELTASGQ